MCAMIVTYDYPVTFFLCYFIFHIVIYNANFDFLFKFHFFILKICGSFLTIDQLYVICW